MGVRSLRVYGPAFLPTSITTLYTVPAGHTLVIRQIRITNTDSAVRNAALYVNGSGAADRVTQLTAIPAQSTIADNGWWALSPGDTLRGAASSASLVNVSVFGSLLVGYVV